MSNSIKTIQNPGQWTLAISLIPLAIVLIYVIVSRHIPTWTYIVGIGSIVLYLGLLTYFCIKQKCYAQLARSYTIIIVGIIIFIIQFVVI